MLKHQQEEISIKLQMWLCY